MRSLRTRLILSTMLGTAAVFVAAGALLYALVRDGLVDQFDRALLDKARLLASAMEWEDGEVDLEFDELDMGEFQPADRPAYLELWLADGSVLFRSPSLGSADLERAAGTAEAPGFRRATLPDGRPGRAVGITFTPRIEKKDAKVRTRNDRPGETPPDAVDPAVALVLARGTAPIDAVLVQLKTLLVAVGALAVALSAGVLWLVVRRSLRPVDGLANQIGRLGEDDLAARVEAPDAPRELEPVVDRLNDLLRRLEAAFERERRFSADVAHELRTPLAGLRSTMDVALTKPRQGPEYEASLRDCLRITIQVQVMVEHLLALARLDAGQMALCPEPVRLNAVIRDAWQPLAERAEARDLDVAWRLGEEVQIVTDPAILGLVIRNVLENAVVHADKGGSVTLETEARDNDVQVRVANSGSQLSQEQADRAFERFWRGDTARTDAGVHCGLGLPLVKTAAEALGGTVQVRSTAGGEFRITVSLPLRPPRR